MFSSSTDIFLITSVINTGNNPWSYSSVRSTYTSQERYEQTLNTIKSIRALNDNAKIILADCSNITDEMEISLSLLVDLYIQLYNNKTIRNACITSNKKGFGELLTTKYVVDYLIDQRITFQRLFKISGRYYLNSSFDKSNFSITDYTFRKPFPNSACNPTVLYSVPFNCVKHFQSIINKCHNEYLTNMYTMFEVSLTTKCKQYNMRYKEIDTCGVSGLVAVDSTTYEDK